MKLYKVAGGCVLEEGSQAWLLPDGWDALINRSALHSYLMQRIHGATPLPDGSWRKSIQAPIGTQEVWAAGVTYRRSMEARMEESKSSGGATFYDKVYDAERPELFFKSLSHRVAGPGDVVHIRRDSSWNVPEPELTLVLNSQGEIQGYTIGNDMSSRSIEGENPLYLPQAKTYDRSAALGPCVLVLPAPIAAETVIHMTILREGTEVFRDEAPISRMKRGHQELAAYLYRETSFPTGCYLMTGTCVVPGGDFTLKEKDEVHITIDGIGTLINRVGLKNT